jgi:hypothetical protein
MPRHCSAPPVVQLFLRGRAFSQRDLADGFDHLFGRHTLQHVTPSSCFECPPDFHIAFKGCQNNYACLGKLCPDGDHGIDAAHTGKPEIHKRYVRFVLAKKHNLLRRIDDLLAGNRLVRNSLRGYF